MIRFKKLVVKLVAAGTLAVIFGNVPAYADKKATSAKSVIPVPKLGVELSNVRTCWEPNGAGFGPGIKFDAKNIGTEPIGSLRLTAAFENPDQKRRLGDAYNWVIRGINAPLKPGYKITDIVILADFFYRLGRTPAITIDLYATTTGKIYLVGTFRIQKAGLGGHGQPCR